jgi:NADH dehydrogenase FAD-containing subunit
MFTGKECSLRMAVQFSIAQGECAAGNIARSIKGHALKKFVVRDLGYIIPLANNRSCGVIFGLKLKGVLPTALHLLMCMYRSYGVRNRLGIAGNLIKPKFNTI